MQNHNPVNIYQHGADLIEPLQQVEAAIAERGIDEKLHHLLLLRVSQINGCAFCVQMHSSDARKAGDSNERLDHLAAWRHSRTFTAAEKSAFAWAEALTELDPERDLAPLRAALREHYSDHEITTLTGMISMINLWNRIQISCH